MVDWKLSRREDACRRCERGFAGEEAHFSVLVFGGDVLAREDFCVDCFGEREPAGGPEELVFWRTRFRSGRGRRGLAVDFEALEALFLALEGRRETHLCELRFLLALLLLRKKRIKLLRTAQGEGGEAMVVRRPRREEELVVRVFDLDAERAEALRDELRAVFEGEGLEGLGAPGSGPEAVRP